MYSKIVGIMLVVLAVVIFVSVAYHNSHKSHEPIVFSDRSMLDGLWHYYQQIYLDPGNGRTVDHDRGNSSTSEGQSYAMLRAVWWNDKAVFDRSWKWTQTNLQHSNDHLFSWYYSQLSDGTYGINAQIGAQNTASDADTDIALALVFANDRWSDNTYLTSAQAIINDIWNNEVMIINGKPYLTADNLEKASASPVAIVNPSYLAPYAYKIFAKYDKAHDWNGLADSSYQVISKASQLKLDKKTSDGLPPNWIAVNKTTGDIQATNNSQLTTEYSYDAMRVPFRLALDWTWFKDPRDKNLLSQFGFLDSQWQQNKTLYSTYTHDGNAVQKNESPAIYGGDIGYFLVEDSSAAKDIYDDKLKILYTPDTDSWKNTLSYYDDNWAWFGMALYNNYLVNLEQNH